MAESGRHWNGDVAADSTRQSCWPGRNPGSSPWAGESALSLQEEICLLPFWCFNTKKDHFHARHCSSEHLCVSFFLNTHQLDEWESQTLPVVMVRSWTLFLAGTCSQHHPGGGASPCVRGHPNFIPVCNKWKSQLLQQHYWSVSQASRDFSLLWNLGPPPYCGCKLTFLSNQLAKQGIVQVLNSVPGTAPRAGRGITAHRCSPASSGLQSVSRWMEGCHSAAGRDWGWEGSSGALPATPKHTSALSLGCCSFSRRAAFHEV